MLAFLEHDRWSGVYAVVHITGLTGLAFGCLNAIVLYTRGCEYALAVKFEGIGVLCEDVYVLHGSQPSFLCIVQYSTFYVILSQWGHDGFLVGKCNDTCACVR